MWKTIGDFWCDLMHDRPMWPIHGHYACRTCRRVYTVPWAAQRRDGARNGDRHLTIDRPRDAMRAEVQELQVGSGRAFRQYGRNSYELTDNLCCIHSSTFRGGRTGRTATRAAGGKLRRSSGPQLVD